jgi:hypothetical protein
MAGRRMDVRDVQNTIRYDRHPTVIFSSAQVEIVDKLSLTII